MIDCKAFYDMLIERGITLFTGVPDSTLKNFCAYVTDNAGSIPHVITANEGAAIGLASGHYFATKQPALAYMQNSGLGNSVNPLTSLADPDVYGIPMMMVIGWRGRPGIKDEPQHAKMGKITLKQLETLDIPYEILPDDIEEAIQAADRLFDTMQSELKPVAFVVKKGTFEKYSLKTDEAPPYPMSRERAVELLVESVGTDTPIISTTGKPSRELFEIREMNKQSHQTDFLTVGSMGHCSHIALGVALANPTRDVYCLDGDGAVIMHLGGLSTIAAQNPTNYKHVVWNNGAHDSVGGQPTVAFDIDLCAIAKASGYKTAIYAETEEALKDGLKKLAEATGPALLEVRVKKGARSDLGRPTMTPKDLKAAFMGYLLR